MDKDMPADWALERACALGNAAGSGTERWPISVIPAIKKLDVHPGMLAFARYIEAHEQPPVDPDLVTAREICARVCNDFGQTSSAKAYRDGDYDAEEELQFALAKLKEARGA